jgi:hypothetical protein
MVNLIEYYHIVRLAQSEELNITAIAKALKCSKIDAMRKVRYAQKHIEDKGSLGGEYRVYESVMGTTFGQFLAVETMLSTASPQEAKMAHVMKCIIRPKGEEVFDNEDDGREQKHLEGLLKKPFWKVLPHINNFLEDRNNFHFAEFKDVFYSAPEEGESVSEGESDSQNETSFERKWYWVSLLDMLSGEDAHKWERSLDLSMQTAAPYIAYKVSKAKKEWADSKRREQEMKARSRR